MKWRFGRRKCLAAGAAGLAGWSSGFGVSMERPELGCLLAGLKLDEELQLLLGRAFISAGRLKWLPRPSPSSVGLQQCCLVASPPLL